MSKLPEFDMEIEKIKTGNGNVCVFRLRCPKCGKIYTEDRYHGNELTREIINNAYIRYGSPIRVCEACGSEFIDRGFHELALEKEPVKSILSRNRSIGRIMALGGVITAVICLLAEFEIAGILGLVGIAVAVAGFAKMLASPKGLKTKEELTEERILSSERVADIEYMEKLRENGIIQ